VHLVTAAAAQRMSLPARHWRCGVLDVCAGLWLQVNQTFTIEPIFVEGSNKVNMWKDDWTATTTDGGLAVQCEHTVLITPNGCEILTLP
jgi:methionyl aminopeptidase